jgi:hypothetical protein
LYENPFDFVFAIKLMYCSTNSKKSISIFLEYGKFWGKLNFYKNLPSPATKKWQAIFVVYLMKYLFGFN